MTEMHTISTPSEVFPAPPSVSIDIPSTWAPVAVPGALMAARGEVDGGLAPNIVVRHSTRPLTFTVAAAVNELATFADQQPEGEIDEPFQVTINEVPVVGVNVSWADPNAGDVVQIHMFAGARSAGLVQLVQVTGSVGGPNVERDYEIVQSAMQSLRIER